MWSLEIEFFFPPLPLCFQTVITGPLNPSCVLGAPWHLPSPASVRLDKVLGSMEPPRGPPANGAEPSRAVGTVKVYLPNKQRTVVSVAGQSWQGVGMDPVVSLGSEG